ncbi:mechanosensitive ion channel family protein [Candidatus Parabeggiatoa sp. HSG14]|uniref:mechanosensitive ion channel family protein n=1 Tax=Candidatus Parabeggiatoa sp. HSG14 TaxID=3055593 RepID=UPI0025A7CACC|nr:mechanosensitive ion channel family protein [Thiotrichales bacterium HSG14]
MFEQWNWWNETLWDISLGNLVLAVLVFLFALLFRKLFAHLVLKQLKNFATKTETTLDDKFYIALESPLKLAFIVVFFYLAIAVLNLSVEFDGILTPLIRSLIAFTLFWAFYRCIEPLSFIVDKLTFAFGTELTYALHNLFVKGLKIFIILMGLTAVLSEWGINVIGLLASLSIVGAALAFSAKDTLSNLFGTLTIVFDNMFKPGDWIMTPEVEGIVAEIGSRSTKIRTFAKAIVTVPNAILANSAVTNWSKMTNRRIKMHIGLEYRTSHEQITRITQRFTDYLKNHPKIETDTKKVATLINLVEFNESSIDILLYYFTKTTHWIEWLHIREENMLEFMKIIEEEGAAFAFPSQQLYMEKLPRNFSKFGEMENNE